MLNSMQAFQLSKALTPTFLSQIPQSSPQASALAMQDQTAAGGIQSELYKKAMKKQKSNPLDTVRRVAGMIPGPQQPFIQAGNAIYDATQGNYDAALSSGMGAAGGFANSFGGGGGANAFQSVPIGNVPSSAPAQDMFGQPVDPFGIGTVNSSAVVGDTTASAPGDVATAAPVDAGGDKSAGGGMDIGAIAAAAGGAALLKGAANRGEANMAQQSAVDMALKDVTDPRQRSRIMQWAQASPQDFQAMQPVQRITAVSGLLNAGIPLTKAQVRGIPASERKMYQKQYGPELFPMTGLDKLTSFIDAYEQSSGPGRIVRPYNGLEMYLP